MSLLEIALCAFAALTAGTGLLVAVLTVVHYRRRPPPTEAQMRALFPHGVPRVTIFKPCKGADPSLYDNLASFMRLEGVPYEVLIGIADPNDPAVEIAQRIIRDFPQREVRLHFTGDKHAHNPKVVNLTHLEAHARGEFFYVADSNIRVTPGLLKRLIAPFADPRVALSYAMFRGVPGRSLGARVQAAIFCTLGMPSIAAAYRLLGIANLVGKCFVLRRTALEKMGGFAHYERYLVEDGLIGREVRAHGLQAVLVNEAVDVHLGEMSLQFLWAQQMRWAVLHRMAFWTLPIGEMVWNPFFIGAVAGAASLGGLHTAAAVLAAAAIHNQLIDIIPFVLFGNRLRDVWLLVLADVVMLGIVTTVWFHRDVVWRGQRFTLGKNTLILAAAPLGGPATLPAPLAQVHALPVRGEEDKPRYALAGGEK